MDANPYYILLGCVIILSILCIIYLLSPKADQVTPPIRIQKKLSDEPSRKQGNQSHRSEIGAQSVILEESASYAKLKSWLSAFEFPNSEFTHLDRILGENTAFAQSHYSQFCTTQNGYLHVNLDCELRGRAHCSVRFHLQPWEKVYHLSIFMAPQADGKRIPAQTQFKHNKELLLKEIGPPDSVEGDDSANTEQAAYIWGDQNAKLTLRLGFADREMIPCCSLHLESQLIKEDNERARVAYNRCNYVLRTSQISKKPVRDAHNIRKNLDIVLKSVECHILDNGACKDITYREIDPYWFDTFKKPKSVLGEDYDDILIGYTGGKIHVVEADGSVLLEKTYWDR